ncbi:MAG: hypothetical protein M0R02_10285, partial [Bacteroidales bacterium]|nr:hypothetical protein [Bacteroidales bacterium]
MASKSLGQLTIDLIAKVGGFVEGMDKAERAANKRAKDIDKALANMAKGAERHLNAAAKAVGAIGVAAVAGGAALVKSAADSAKEITTLSQVANTSAEDFQRWAVGAKTVGIEQTKLADILKDMNDRVGDFLSTGGGPMKDFFENIAPQVGVTADQFRKLSGPEALQLYVSSLEKANLAQGEMTFYMEAVASDATALLPLLRDNGAEIERLGDRAAELGAILSDVEVAQLAEVSKQLDELGLVVEGLGNKIAIAALPAMKEFGALLQDKATIEGLQTLVAGLVDFGGWVVKAGAGIANFSRWLGEEVAAAVNGPAIGDLVRLEEELIDLEGRRQALIRQAEASGRAAGEDPRVKALDAQIAKTREMIAVTNDLAA